MTEEAKPTKSNVAIPETISVHDFADQLGLKVTEVIGELMKNGVMATINDNIDFETAAIVGGELGFEIVAEQAKSADSKDEKQPEQKIVLAEGEGEPRPPVIVVMGHVDHGKTSLLDAIRQSEVASGEAGGITQHVSAYQVTHNKRVLTLMDTPGHEAFSVLREHGAHLTDVAIIVVAADDGVQPQTIEAIDFAKKAGVHMVVAINKIDKPGADVNRIKTQLSEHGLVAEDFGGDTVMVEVSATKRENIAKLLDMVLLVADIEDLRALTSGPAEGMVIEAHMATGKGSVATLLVENGELKVGDYLVAGEAYGRVRRLEDFEGHAIKKAGPSQPAQVSGWKLAPVFGDQFKVVASEKEARNVVAARARRSNMHTTAAVKKISHHEKLATAMAEHKTEQLPVVVKADVQGSLQSVIQSLESLGNDEVKVKIIGQGLGSISESDVSIADSAGAVIVGFNVQLPIRIKQLASRDEVDVKLYKVIYELLDDVRERLNTLLKPEVVEEFAASLIVKGVFRVTKNQLICGGQVNKGKLRAGLIVVREVDGEKQELGLVKSVQKEQQVAKEIKEGEMCGLEIETSEKVTPAIDEVLEFIERTERERSL